MALVGVYSDEVAITLPMRFRRDWIASCYSDRLNALCPATPTVRSIKLRVVAAMSRSL
jgi:hypothetical protein